MRQLHIVQGGIDNGDKKWLEAAAVNDRRAKSWVVPRSATIGDDVVIHIGGYGFFATAQIGSESRPRPDWPNRYGAALESIRLIAPAISLGAVARQILELAWARYPRSVTTPGPDVATRIRRLVRERRRSGAPETSDYAIATANLDELRAVALMRSRPSATPEERRGLVRARSEAIRLYVLRRANGRCEACGAPAPFRTPDGSDYLEPHHTTRLADGGPDHPAHVIALCPICHRRAHHAEDREAFNARLVRRLDVLERR